MVRTPDAGDALDRRGDQVRRRIVQRGQKAAGDDGTLGHDAVAGDQRLSGRRVVDDGAQQQPVQRPAVHVVERHDAGQHPVGQSREQVHDRRDHEDVHRQPSGNVDGADRSPAAAGCGASAEGCRSRSWAAPTPASAGRRRDWRLLRIAPPRSARRLSRFRSPRSACRGCHSRRPTRWGEGRCPRSLRCRRCRRSVLALT